jgi:uncharacterized protein
MYQHPGVYIEHVISNALSIEAASTSVTAFIGHARRGTSVTKDAGAPIFVTSVGQYAAAFGPAGGGPGGIKNDGDNADAFGHAVNLYFANGGTKAYIVPVSNDAGTAAASFTPAIAAVAASPAVPATATEPAKPAVAAVAAVPKAGGMALTIGGTSRTLTLTASSPGIWANPLLVRLENGNLAGECKLTIGTQTAASRAEPDITKKAFDVVIESFNGLSVDATSPSYIITRITQLSALVTATLSGTANTVPLTKPEAVVTGLPRNALFEGGVDSAVPKPADYAAAFDRLRDYRDVSIMLMPGQVYTGDGATIFDSALTHAEFMQNRLVVVDPNPALPLKTPTDVQSAGLPTSTYAVLYYPQITVANPYYDAENAANLPRSFPLGPAAAAAGMWARIDGTRGVWKTPAGLEATVRGTLGPTILIGNELQDNLNEWGVNCLRAIIGPTVIWGGRTLATKARPQFRYVAVRRTQSMIGESLYRALQAVVFEPNDHKLWGALRASVGDFMDGLHRSGAFQGEKSSDAWFVRCGLGSTMTQGDIDGGIVRVVVGFAPLKPAEFVVVEIQQKVGQAA